MFGPVLAQRGLVGACFHEHHTFRRVFQQPVHVHVLVRHRGIGHDFDERSAQAVDTGGVRTTLVEPAQEFRFDLLLLGLVSLVGVLVLGLALGAGVPYLDVRLDQ